MRSMLLAAVLMSAVTHSGRADDNSGKLAKDAPSPLTAPFDAGQAEAVQEAWVKYLGRSSPVEKNSIGMELVLIPPGKFRMGSPASEKDRSDGEVQVDVTLTKPFYLGKTEVTQGQWRAVMGTTPWKGKGSLREEGENYPATYVSWEDVQAFCKKLSEMDKWVYRLPTEAEWEYACRAGTTTRFSFGNDETKLSNYAWWGGRLGDGNAKDEEYAHEVGQKQPNSLGLYDLHGNIWEWCEDVYAFKLPGGTNPLASTGGSLRVVRGGSWYSEASHCRSANRHRYAPDSRDLLWGFRVARGPVSKH